MLRIHTCAQDTHTCSGYTHVLSIHTRAQHTNCQTCESLIQNQHFGVPKHRTRNCNLNFLRRREAYSPISDQGLHPYACQASECTVIKRVSHRKHNCRSVCFDKHNMHDACDTTPLLTRVHTHNHKEGRQRVSRDKGIYA